MTLTTEWIDEQLHRNAMGLSIPHRKGRALLKAMRAVFSIGETVHSQSWTDPKIIAREAFATAMNSEETTT